MFRIFSRLKWVYQKFKVSTWLPFIILLSYTLLGAAIFRAFESENDKESRHKYEQLVNDSMDQNEVKKRMKDEREEECQGRQRQRRPLRCPSVWFHDR
ncbi:hypothetical protein WR25_04177 [Diploscapter pachys]|uniref:Uncharacterized protein n=1 Tax=Diploscapter pachys TaxID=2018661 RepID=A0A2A2LGK2_9BILA|nr:hypothetical protein WR25_04177 [Diploscapter pachys]